MTHRFYAILASWTLSVSLGAGATDLPRYQKIPGVSGNLSSVGSDTLSGMTTLWLEEFKTIYPNVNAQIQASGSSTAPPALAEGTAQFGPMSRAMRLQEVTAFEREYGYKPTALSVAIDAIGIFVHKDNPIKGLNFEELDSIFSATLRCGALESVQTWSDLGVESSWSQRPIQMFGRNSVSGTYGFFKKNALCGGDFKRNVNEQPGSASAVQSVASSVNTIGYSGIGYKVSDARLLPIAKYGKQYVYPHRENVLSGDYPLSRYLYIYVNKNPNKPLEPIEEAYIRYIYSQEGQQIVEQDGYVPLTRSFVEHELSKVGLSLAQ
ncbi:phosphate ABC transporter substrate-binding protein [Vibrio sp. 10N.286.49.C2]|uniref:PstS family phosphate ABC transporter substrate-binding protein n=1 Tax=unclassified Vibrio TaxID=2614977 RepID=UPI000C85EC07|nr:MULTISPECIES: phosphate ABC transporter substrate-binding protein PstS family protein [unclassified Vibrio]PMH33342.1 phosphate ABC transporter substrate-binding protein [Vibrio sp. 10N.286.49.C2]PMH48239.1 phosphate ABC transporter substrate-binding protein [Vibrio sp. 10N.286.49.B1]PMH80401.1 phosphate ABC transporter substrate-binding protein [Vibrio sp. 10N.286.48.B7]